MLKIYFEQTCEIDPPVITPIMVAEALTRTPGLSFTDLEDISRHLDVYVSRVKQDLRFMNKGEKV